MIVFQTFPCLIMTVAGFAIFKNYWCKWLDACEVFRKFLIATGDKWTPEILDYQPIRPVDDDNGGNHRISRKEIEKIAERRFKETGRREYIDFLDAYDAYVPKAIFFAIFAMFGLTFGISLVLAYL